MVLPGIMKKSVKQFITLTVVKEIQDELFSLGITAEVAPKDYIKIVKIRFHSEEDYNLFRLSSKSYKEYDCLDCVIVP